MTFEERFIKSEIIPDARGANALNRWGVKKLSDILLLVTATDNELKQKGIKFFGPATKALLLHEYARINKIYIKRKRNKK